MLAQLSNKMGMVGEKKRPLEVNQMLIAALRKSSKGTIRTNRQEDAHEALCVLLEMMQRSCLSRAGLPVTTRVDGASESTFVHAIFGGATTTNTVCPQCKHVSPKTDSFLQLSLDLDASADRSSVNSLLERMRKVEKLDAKNLWECEKCRKKVRAERATSISKAPNVLVVHLKRFAFTFVGGTMRRTKLKNPVAIGGETLVLPISTGGAKETYDLFGVLIHRGASVHSGHYIAYVKCAANRFWYETDDEVVRRIKPEAVLANKDAYILFYAKRSALALPAAVTASALPRRILTNGNGKSTPKAPVEKSVLLPLGPVPLEAEKRVQTLVKSSPVAAKAADTPKQRRSNRLQRMLNAVNATKKSLPPALSVAKLSRLVSKIFANGAIGSVPSSPTKRLSPIVGRQLSMQSRTVSPVKRRESLTRVSPQSGTRVPLTRLSPQSGARVPSTRLSPRSGTRVPVNRSLQAKEASMPPSPIMPLSLASPLPPPQSEQLSQKEMKDAFSFDKKTPKKMIYDRNYDAWDKALDKGKTSKRAKLQ